ncbi:hypothetical protein [Desulfoluna butyratoxydans]|uniref:Uncharacterized protein n=1 Tax=Desulfoluna butyratoxydans TaxID=231438 RepID=A0A4U8YMS7_9BACT|nr:hypothetical protein [Desulfoluna butyratoxydans]VFQ45346.1 hypothetical protein MSL71_30030 [Desulfoluna butyratoxydans]
MPMCGARPAYPFNDILPGAVGQNARHHLIPWAQVCAVGRDYIIDEQARIQAVFDHYDAASLLAANLGGWGGTGQAKVLAGGDGLINQILVRNGEALEEFAGLLSWLPGNLVVGPTVRPLHPDPGEAFDDFACERRSATDGEYADLRVEWENADDQQKFELIKDLAGKAILNDSANAGLW